MAAYLFNEMVFSTRPFQKSPFFLQNADPFCKRAENFTSISFLQASSHRIKPSRFVFLQDWQPVFY